MRLDISPVQRQLPSHLRSWFRSFVFEDSLGWEYRLNPSARLAGETANVFPEFGIMFKDLLVRAKRPVGEVGRLEFRVECLNHDPFGWHPVLCDGYRMIGDL